MAVSGEQQRKDLSAGVRFLEAVDRAFPGKIDAELLAALRGAEEHPPLLDLLVKALAGAK